MVNQGNVGRAHFGIADLDTVAGLPCWATLDLARAKGEHHSALISILGDIRSFDPRVFQKLVDMDAIRPKQHTIEIRRRMYRIVSAAWYVVDVSGATDNRQLGRWIRINRWFLRLGSD